MRHCELWISIHEQAGRLLCVHGVARPASTDLHKICIFLSPSPQPALARPVSSVCLPCVPQHPLLILVGSSFQTSHNELCSSVAGYNPRTHKNNQRKSGCPVLQAVTFKLIFVRCTFQNRVSRNASIVGRLVQCHASGGTHITSSTDVPRPRGRQLFLFVQRLVEHWLQFTRSPNEL